MVRLLKLELPEGVCDIESKIQNEIEVIAEPEFFRVHAPEPNKKTKHTSKMTTLPRNMPEPLDE